MAHIPDVVDIEEVLTQHNPLQISLAGHREYAGPAQGIQELILQHNWVVCNPLSQIDRIVGMALGRQRTHGYPKTSRALYRLIYGEEHSYPKW